MYYIWRYENSVATLNISFSPRASVKTPYASPTFQNVIFPYITLHSPTNIVFPLKTLIRNLLRMFIQSLYANNEIYQSREMGVVGQDRVQVRSRSGTRILSQSEQYALPSWCFDLESHPLAQVSFSHSLRYFCVR